MTTNQTGLAPIFVVLFLVVSVLGGTYLVQQRTNILPFAAESNECGVRIDNDVCIKKGVKEEEYKPNLTSNRAGITRPIADKSLCGQDQCNQFTSAHCFQNVILGNNQEANHNIYACGSYNAIDPKAIYKAVTFENLNVLDDGKVTVVNGSECNNQCSSGEKCLAAFLPVKATADLTNQPRNLYAYFCYPTEKIKQIPAERLNSVFVAGNTENTLPTDPASCKELKTCVYSQGADECYLGICKDGKDCGFNSPDCSYQNGADKSCLNTNYDHQNSGYTVSGKVGAKVQCPATPSQGGTTGSTTTSSTETSTTEQPTTREALYEKCGFTPQSGSIPFEAIGLGENQQINDEHCKNLLQAQRQYFNDYLERAKNEAAEAAKNNNLIYDTDKNVFVVDTSKVKTQEERRLSQERATELNSSLAEPIKQAEQKSDECENKDNQELTECLKAAHEPVQKAATAAQSQAVKNSLAKFKEIKAGNRPGGCVKADLGITPFLEAQRLKRRDPGEEDRRLLLCAGKNDPKQLKWRVMVEGNAGAEFADEDGVDEGNDAERVWGVHGESRDATGDPKYPYTVRPGGKNSFVIADPNTEEGLRTTMGAYIDAAEAGKSTLRSAPVPGDDGVDIQPGGAESEGSTSQSSTNQQSSGGGCSQDDYDDCIKNEGPLYTQCTREPGKSKKCSIPDDKKCSEGSCPNGQVCNRTSGQCVTPRTNPTNNCPGGVCP